MKIAILFSGRMDRFDEHYTNIMENIVQGNDADFFLSTVCSNNELERFCLLYNPVSITNDDINYEEYKEFEGNRYHLTNFHNMMCMHCHRMRVYEELVAYVKATNTQYDFIISMRLDAYSDSKLDYSLFRRDVANILYIPLGYDWGGVNDQMAIGGMEAMEVYMNVYKEMGKWLSVPAFGPETILQNHLASYTKIVIERFPFKYRLINGKFYKHHTDPIVH
jgi:hypothetical protein